MNPAQAIALYQPTLHRIAYNLVRCKADAEDIVQETFLKWLSAETSKVQNTKAYLIKSVTNNCLKHLEAIKKKKTECLDAISKTEIVNLLKETNFSHLDLEADLEKAFRLIHTKLEPLERAAYLLKEAFDVDYDALQAVFDKKKEHCRQLVCRAKKKLNDEKDKIQLDLPDFGPLMASFRKSCEIGNPRDFIQELKNDIARSISKKS